MEELPISTDLGLNLQFQKLMTSAPGAQATIAVLLVSEKKSI